MIISASRRTDIPAFYGEWFLNRLKAEEVLVRNPMNPKQITSIPLNPDIVDCIVFWTKDPKQFLPYLNKIDKLGYKYYFQFTLNSYDKTIEENVAKKPGIINTFKTLSDMIAPDKVIWRYDPILFNKKYTIDYHIKWFNYLSEALTGYTKECVISFLEEYRKIKTNISEHNIESFNMERVLELSKSFGEISSNNNIRLSTCANNMDLEKFNIGHSKCVDGTLIEKIVGYKILTAKDGSQRKECGCIESRDIGSYNSCKHFCIYCYANFNKDRVIKNIKRYNPQSPLLCDELNGDEKITKYKKAKSLKYHGVLQPALQYIPGSR